VARTLSNEATESHAVESIKKRLGEERAEAERLERCLRAVKRRRFALATKLVHAGLPRRKVARLAGVSDVAILNYERADHERGEPK